MNLISFTLCEKEYAIEISAVREVRRVRNITPVPRSMESVAGVISLRGKVVPIIDTKKKLGLATAEKTSLNRVLITEVGGHTIGLVVDSIIGVLKIDESAIEPPDELLKKADYLVGVGKVDKRLILIIDMKRLLSGEDKTGITELHKKVEIRKRG